MKNFLLAGVLLLSFHVCFSQEIYRDYIDGRIYLKVSGSTLKSTIHENPDNIPLKKTGELEEVLSEYNITKIARPFYRANDDINLSSILQIEFTQKAKIDKLIRELTTLRDVVYAEKIPLLRTDATPNDPLYSGAAHLTQINAPNAWNVFNGNSNITVAIVDNAVMWTHADLVANTYTNTLEASGTTGVDDDGNGYIDDINGWDAGDNDNNPLPSGTNSLSFDHGTHCAGIAGARTDNGIGVASIGWNIKIIPVKAEPSSGSSNSVTMGYEGIIYAVKVKARIISCSWGGPTSSATQQSVINYAWNRGCIIMASAGNFSSTTPNYPGAYNNVYCVAAVNPSNVKSSYSNYGSWVDISAPGDNIVSTVPYASTPAYQAKSGTSMATPLVAGLAALMLSKSPNMTRTDVLNCISTTAVNIYSISGNSSFTSQLGAGRIEAFAAMNCAANYTALPPVANFYAFPLNTCPNTPVNFYDSSLYVPTSYTWSFQGGSPATSTLANPTVSWSTPGTYSVSLIVTNANGTNTKTKLNYITVSGPVALPLVEGFQGTQFLPPNWTANNLWNDNIYWTRVTGVGGFGTSTASAMFDNYNLIAPGELDEMRTPKYNFNNVGSARLRFDVAYARYNSNFSDTLEVRVSTNCGATWTSIYLKGGTALSTRTDIQSYFSPTSTQWRRDTIDISTLTAGQGNVMFSFLNRGHYGQPIYLDNINLVFPTPTVNTTFNGSVCAGSQASYVNTSFGAATYTWNFAGGSPASSTSSNQSVTYLTPGTYTTVLIGVNGTSTASITKTVNVFSNPTITVNNPTVCNGSQVTLTAAGATTYTWNNGPSTNIFVVTPTANSTYTVTGTNGGVCSASGFANVQVIAVPVLTALSQTMCSGQTVTLSVSGALTYSWSSGSTSASFTVSPSANTTYTVTGTSNGCSNTKTVSVGVTPTPSMSITSTNMGTVCAGTSVTLTASGATSYSWNTGPITNSIVVSPTISTLYVVTGTNGNCSEAKMVTVTVGNASLAVTIQSPPSVCAGSSATVIATGAATYTWNTGSNGPSIIVTPTVNTVISVTGSSASCSGNASITLVVSPLPLSVVTVTNSECTTICNGAVNAISTSGTAPYSYSLSASPCTLLPCAGLCQGFYTLHTTDAAGCVSQNFFSIECLPVGISENSPGIMKIFPNPATKELNILYDGEFDYVLYNKLGQLIREEKNNYGTAKINVENYAKGIYSICIKGNYRKVIIE